VEGPKEKLDTTAVSQVSLGGLYATVLHHNSAVPWVLAACVTVEDRCMQQQLKPGMPVPLYLADVIKDRPALQEMRRILFQTMSAVCLLCAAGHLCCQPGSCREAACH
jgi:hypothetical protein